MTRHAGVILPLFSAASSASWGLGELRDLDPLSVWLAAGGFDRLMILPLGTMSPAETSPYSAASAMALDPIYIALGGLEDYERAGGDAALSSGAAQALDTVRTSPHVAYSLIRRVKAEALDLAFVAFVRDEWQAQTARAASLAAYIARERWWLDDYALFQALAGAVGTAAWRQWPDPIRDRNARALDEVRRQLARDVLRHQYLQWIAETEWHAARAVARRRGLTVVGDVPFAVAVDSADVWARPGEFMLDVSAGVPPDAFSEEGQDWGLPTYRWDVIAASDFAWIRQRARRMAALYDSVRVDHLVGYFRTYGRLPDGRAFFIPPDEPSQIRQGDQILRIFLETGTEVLAEDLGTVPDFVRASMADLGVPGCKVLRWERDYHSGHQGFIDPSAYPPVSVALTGTHDTETLAAWWDGASEDERRAFLSVPSLGAGSRDPRAPWSDDVRDLVLDALYRSGSNHLFFPLQDVFGWRDRVNTPSTVNEINWTWKLPWPVETLGATPVAAERAEFCRRLAQASGRALAHSAG
ncbi:MAG: 4-alpha-glucanotransferase [Vicinamibacterales bacterium]